MTTSLLYASPDLANQHIDELRRYAADQRLARSAKRSDSTRSLWSRLGPRRLRPAPAR
jgi:hypothetical protein